MVKDKGGGSPRPRVFVSSVVENFGKYRETARKAIERAGGEPVLVNEDFPAIADSSRNACLDGVESSDIFLVIIGNRGGWRTPSGKLVIEEEYHHSVAKKLPTLVFIQRVDRDDDANRLVRELENYVDGNFRVSFETVDDLNREIERALNPLMETAGKQVMDQANFRQIFSDSFEILNEASIRIALAPERSEELIDPVRLESDDFLHVVYEFAHSRDVHLFNYRYRKEDKIEENFLVVHQSAERSSNNTVEEVRLKVTERGEIIIDANVTNRVQRGDRYDFSGSMVVAQNDVEAVLRQIFSFCKNFFAEIDKFKRHQRFFYNAALKGLGHRTWTREVREQSSFPVNIVGGDEPINAYDQPRPISRGDLQNPGDEIGRVLTVLSRKVNHS